MALLQDLEPPSSGTVSRSEGSSSIQSEQVKPIAFWGKFVDKIMPAFKKLFFVSHRTESGSRGIVYVIKILAQSVRSFFVSSKYFPHYALVFILATVLASNISDTAKAAALSRSLVEVDPDSETAIVQSIQDYTPMLSNSSDMLAKAYAAIGTTEGFAQNTASVDTQITARTEPLPDNASDTVFYIVRSGDTLSGLSAKFGVKIATIKYLNTIDTPDMIKPGFRMQVPKKGYEVSPTLIAQRENQKNAKLAVASRNTVTRDAVTRTISRPVGSMKNAYPFGWCTYYVATRRAVPGQWGNAGQWLSSAKRDGYSTGSTPVAGAIMVSRESFWGHVAYVESVGDGNFTVSEMNAPIWGVRTSRTISSSDSKMKGFIY